MESDLNVKDQLRSDFLNLRKNKKLFTDELIFQQVSNFLDKFLMTHKGYGFIGIYWPLAGEIDLRPLSQCPELLFALPACKPEGCLSYHPWNDSSLEKDFHGIASPMHLPPLNPDELKLLLVPALAIDHAGIRLGYGGGYFDRLRSNFSWRSIPSLVVLPQACVSSQALPRNSWDVPFDGWISEEGTTFCVPMN